MTITTCNHDSGLEVKPETIMFSIRNGHYWVHRKNIDKTYRLGNSTIVQYSNFDHWLIDYKKEYPYF